MVENIDFDHFFSGIAMIFHNFFSRMFLGLDLKFEMFLGQKKIKVCFQVAQRRIFWELWKNFLVYFFIFVKIMHFSHNF